MESGGASVRDALANPREWQVYSGRSAFAIPLDRIKAPYRRKVLLALFPKDKVDDAGWWHAALGSAQETAALRLVVGATTGLESNLRLVLAETRNCTRKESDPFLIPIKLLLPVMQQKTGAVLPAPPSPSAPPIPQRTSPSPQSTPQVPSTPPVSPTPPVLNGNGEEKPMDLDAMTRELKYGKDAQGPYAMYRIKPGEALYTAVVVRFTDIHDNTDIMNACEIIRQRSGIKSVQNMPPGQKVLIPLEMLSDRYTPKGSEQRRDFEETVQEAQRLRGEQVKTHELEGVVVVLDPGHGARDQGACIAARGLYESEINYDIACRVKKVLETHTRARVYMTLRDPSRGYEPTDSRTFRAHNRAQVLTTPAYENYDAKISANLRWYLANSIFHKELANGTDPRKVVFTSFHTDAQYNATLRGAMIYVPGAKYRREQEARSGPMYARFQEVHEQPCAASTPAERRRDEALSRNFADDIMQALGEHHIRRHMEGDWIRSQIQKDSGKVYLPAVLRNTLIPIKLLIEVANMTNETDAERLADAKWRQEFAEAYVDALKKHYGA
jgi:N-acetylmuramoyl-L-alanine amidase